MSFVLLLVCVWEQRSLAHTRVLIRQLQDACMHSAASGVVDITQDFIERGGGSPPPPPRFFFNNSKLKLNSAICRSEGIENFTKQQRTTCR